MSNVWVVICYPKILPSKTLIVILPARSIRHSNQEWLRYTLTERDKLSLSVISRQWRSIEILRLAIIIFSVKLTDDTFKYKQVGPWPFEVTRRHFILEADFSTL